MSKSMIEMVREQRDALVKPANDAIASAEAEQRSLTPEESVLVDAAASDEVQALDARIEQLTNLAQRNAAANAELPQIRVKSEEHVYRRDGKSSFLSDLYAQTFNRGDVRGASERLWRHEQQMTTEYRDTVVAGMAGTVPPKYLVDQYSAIARAGRPFLNSLNSQPLPPDFVATFIPRATTGATAAVATEGAPFNDSDMVITNDTPTVQLIGDQVDISRTLFERGGYVVDGIILPDLVAAAELVCDLTALQGTNNTTSILGPLAVSGINSVAYTDASPTVAELWSKLADAVQRVNSNRYAPATAIYMHPRRWGWFTAALDTQNRPLFNFSTVPPVTVIGLGSALEYGQVVGSLMGLPVITDANLPTTWASGVASTSGTEDVILIARTTDFILWEDPMMRFTFEQAPVTAPGQVRLAAGRFTFDHFNRFPKGISIVAGTGLVNPTF